MNQNEPVNQNEPKWTKMNQINQNSENQERIKPGEWIYPYVGTDDV